MGLSEQFWGSVAEVILELQVNVTDSKTVEEKYTFQTKNIKWLRH
jgi:hypothetical protein